MGALSAHPDIPAPPGSIGLAKRREVQTGEASESRAREWLSTRHRGGETLIGGGLIKFPAAHSSTSLRRFLFSNKVSSR